MRTRAAELLEQALREDAAKLKAGEIYKSDHDNYHYARSLHGQHTLGPFNSQQVAQHAVDHEHEIEAKRQVKGAPSLRGHHSEPGFHNGQGCGIDHSKAGRASLNDRIIR